MRNFFPSFLSFFSSSVNYVCLPQKLVLIQTRDRFKGFTIGVFDFLLLLDLSPLHSPFLPRATCPTVFASRVTKDAEIQKSRSSSGSEDLFFPPAISVIQWPRAYDLSLPSISHSPPLFRPGKGPSSTPFSLRVFSFLPARLSGVLNPFFPVSCRATAVYIAAARGLHAPVCVRVQRVNCCVVGSLEFRYYPRAVLISARIGVQRFPASTGPGAVHCDALWDFRVCFSCTVSWCLT